MDLFTIQLNLYSHKYTPKHGLTHSLAQTWSDLMIYMQNMAHLVDLYFFSQFMDKYRQFISRLKTWAYHNFILAPIMRLFHEVIHTFTAQTWTQTWDYTISLPRSLIFLVLYRVISRFTSIQSQAQCSHKTWTCSPITWPQFSSNMKIFSQSFHQSLHDTQFTSQHGLIIGQLTKFTVKY